MNKLFTLIKNTFYPNNEEHYEFILPENSAESVESNDEVKTDEINSQKDPESVFPSLSVNLDFLKVKYNTLINSDIVVREFTLTARNRQYGAFLIYIDGMVDTKIINDFVLEPLMLRNRANSYDGNETRIVSEAISNNITVRKVKKFDLVDYIYNSLVPQNAVKKKKSFNDILPDINMGNCLLFVDTIDTAFSIDAKGFKQRGVDSPKNETVIRGAQEAFTEAIRTNTSMIRRFVNNENLVIESLSVGKVTKTKCAVCYMKDIANDDLVAEVKYRLNNLDIDTIISSGQLEQLIEDNSKCSLPQMLSTERPDKAANHILSGRVVVIVNGSPYVLIMPCVFVDFLSSAEDPNLKFQYANLLKFVRLVAFFITLHLPGLYVAITNFHQEIIPTELLFAIVASRESVPFPIIVEILAMEISFELIREASLRVPSPIGTTIGIIGALILGQAAVEASIVSPILIIIIAITGITSFAIPDFYLSFHLRIARFLYIIAGFLAGFLGIGIVLFVHLILLCSLKSFGVSYLAAYIPATSKNNKAYFMPPFWSREKRPDFLNSKRPKKQDRISMKWKYQLGGKNGN